MIYTNKTFPIEVKASEADVCLVGIPWDSSEIGQSVKHGPLFIREAIKNMEWFDPDTKKSIDDIKFCDIGDVEIVPANWSLTKERIRDTVDWLFKENNKVFPIFLGGDHLISLGVIEAMKDKIGTIVHIDAHADISEDWLGESYSHISWGYHAMKMGFNFIQLGVRSYTKNEWEFFQANKEKFKTLAEIKGPVYLTVDMDVFDPGFAPEVGTPEPLGLTPKEVLEKLKKICENEIVGMDIVECASQKVNTPTAALAAQIIKKVLLWKQKM